MAQLLFDEEKHQYYDGGIELPSVTQITRFLQVDVAASAKSWLRDIAADRGRRIHEYCSEIDFGVEPEIVDWDCAGYVQAYKTFLRDYRIKGWQAVELSLGSAELGFAGTLDRLGIIDCKITIMDIKTGAKLYKTALTAQLTGYAELTPLTGIHAEQLIGLHLKKSGSYTVHICEYDIRLFNACKLLHERLGSKNGRK